MSLSILPGSPPSSGRWSRPEELQESLANKAQGTRAQAEGFSYLLSVPAGLTLPFTSKFSSFEGRGPGPPFCLLTQPLTFLEHLL